MTEPVSISTMATEAELEVLGRGALLRRHRELHAKGKWPLDQIEREAERLRVFEAIAADLAARAQGETPR